MFTNSPLGLYDGFNRVLRLIAFILSRLIYIDWDCIYIFHIDTFIKKLSSPESLCSPLLDLLYAFLFIIFLYPIFLFVFVQRFYFCLGPLVYPFALAFYYRFYSRNIYCSYCGSVEVNSFFNAISKLPAKHILSTSSLCVGTSCFT